MILLLLLFLTNGELTWTLTAASALFTALGFMKLYTCTHCTFSFVNDVLQTGTCMFPWFTTQLLRRQTKENFFWNLYLL